MTFDSEMCKCIRLISAQRNPFLDVCCNWGPLQLWHNVTTSNMKSIFHTQACSFLPEFITLLNNCQRGLFSETTTQPQRIAMGKKTRLYGIIIMPQNQIKIFFGCFTVCYSCSSTRLLGTTLKKDPYKRTLKIGYIIFIQVRNRTLIVLTFTDVIHSKICNLEYQ